MRRQRFGGGTLRWVLGALVLVVVLAWIVAAGCSNVYDRGTACKVDPTLDCEKPWHGPSYTRPD